MKSSLKKLYDSLENENSGKSIDALKRLYRVLEKQIDQCYKEVEDIHNIFRGYMEDMQGIIAPKNYSEMMQVDRNDIWWNMEAIAGASEAIGLLKYERETYESFPSLDDSEEEIENQRRNGREIEEIFGIIDRYRNRLTDCMDDMNGLYRNRVVPYEDKDDEYARKAKKFYDKYTNTWERICDRTSSINRSINDVFEGVLSSIADLVTGVAGLVIGIVTYIPAGIGLAVTKATGDVPDFLENSMKTTKNYNDQIGAVLKDPALMVEGLGQNISDSWEEKGVAYCTGYATGEVLQAVVLKKISVSKLNKVDDVSVISKSKIIIKGKHINVAEILAGLGVSNKKVTSIISKLNIDDLKKLYIYLEKNPDVHKTNQVIDKILKGDSVDDVIKGGARVSFDNKIPRSGAEWNEYLKGKYGGDNVHWNINSVDDVLSDPTRLKGYTIDELKKVLGSDWSRGIYGSNGGGWKLMNGDISIFYHPGGGKHGGSYYGISSGATGKIKVVNPETYILLKGDKATIIYD